jgi:hypothetical protein
VMGRGLAARPCTARDQTVHPAHTWQVMNAPGVANCKGPGVLVGGVVDAMRRTLPGCSVACHVG